MADAKKCDRCKQYYDKSAFNCSVVLHCGWEEPVTYDLCDVCFEEFTKFIKDAALDEDN